MERVVLASTVLDKQSESMHAGQEEGKLPRRAQSRKMRPDVRKKKEKKKKEKPGEYCEGCANTVQPGLALVQGEGHTLNQKPGGPEG